MSEAVKIKPDLINEPPHYKSNGGVECIQAIRASMTKEEFIGFCKGQVFKYLWRANKKHADPLADYEKAQFYLKKMIHESLPADYGMGGRK